MNRYLGEFLTDPRVIDNLPGVAQQLLVRGIIAPIRSGIVNPFKPGGSTKLYQELWTENGSPLKYYGKVVTEKVARELGEDYVVRLAMRYQSPSIASALDELLAEQVSSILVFPLFPPVRQRHHRLGAPGGDAATESTADHPRRQAHQ